ncbi:MAG TPA: PadR family transcriptional regulator [Planctomycetaceae bacterium]|nr:PadR family transcriptional regulator [Planctomycetaceae bacterium]
MAYSKELVAASATPLILSVLAHGENYGYAIIKRVAALTEGEMQWTDGMLYPVLHRLEEQGYIESEWRAPEGGRRRKYYHLRKDGAAALAEERRKWNVVNTALMSLWEVKPCLT